MKPYAHEVENLRLLLLAGIVSLDDVVARADQTILRLPGYDDELVEIALGANVQVGEMLTRPSRASEGADALEAVRNLVGRMHRVLLTDWSGAGRFILELGSIWSNWLDDSENVSKTPKWPDEVLFSCSHHITPTAEIALHGLLW